MIKPAAISMPRSLVSSETVIWSVAFLVPFLLPLPQLITGTIVNAALIAGALRLSSKSQAPLYFLPSLAQLSRNAVFGPFTWYLVYFLPFIWLSNFLYMRIFGRLAENRPAYISVLMAAGVKALLLFVAAQVYVSLGLVPAVFLTAMGTLQLTTALLGGAVALSLVSGVRK